MRHSDWSLKWASLSLVLPRGGVGCLKKDPDRCLLSFNDIANQHTYSLRLLVLYVPVILFPLSLLRAIFKHLDLIVFPSFPTSSFNSFGAAKAAVEVCVPLTYQEGERILFFTMHWWEIVLHPALCCCYIYKWRPWLCEQQRIAVSSAKALIDQGLNHTPTHKCAGNLNQKSEKQWIKGLSHIQ